MLTLTITTKKGTTVLECESYRMRHHENAITVRATTPDGTRVIGLFPGVESIRVSAVPSGGTAVGAMR